MSSEKIEALFKALQDNPENHTLRLMLAELLQETGRTNEAIKQYALLLEGGHIPTGSLLSVARFLLDAEALDLAQQCLRTAREAGIAEGLEELQAELEKKLNEYMMEKTLREPESYHPSYLEEMIDKNTGISFKDVGGLDEVKKIIQRMIILPFQQPELYLKYGKKIGGGVLLYGPPGCGKTLLARATAGECGLPFFNIRIEDILDPYFGNSERRLHGAFEQAREYAPCVLFIDELDALAYSRHKQHGGTARTLVDLLLQELDAIGAENQNILIIAATNAPWDIDNALLRPGRFDRKIFIPPPDAEARYYILKLLTTHIPQLSLDLKNLAKLTSLFSGADLRALVEQAVDRVIDKALDSGSEPPLLMEDFQAVLSELRPSTLEWLAHARNYIEFANQGKRYEDIYLFLKTKEVKRWDKL